MGGGGGEGAAGAGAAGLGGGLGGGLTHLAFKLRGQRVEFIAGLAEGVGFIAQNAGGGLFDAFAQAGDGLGGLSVGLTGFLQEALLDELARGIQRPFRLLLLGLAIGVIKLAREQRLGRVGPFDGLLHVVQQVLQLLTLLLEILRHLLAPL